MSGSLINSNLQQLAFENLRKLAAFEREQEKQAFVPGGDPAMTGGAPPGGDPAAMGGDPAAMGGMPPGGDPAAMGGMPPGGDPAAMGGGAPAPPAEDPMIAIQSMIQSAVQQAMAGQGSAGAGAGAAVGMKPKIDINIEIMKMNKMLARIADGLGIPIPAADMVGTADDLNQMAAGQQTGAASPAGPTGSLGPMQSLQPMAPAAMGGEQKIADYIFPGGYAEGTAARFGDLQSRAQMILAVRAQR